MGLFKHQPIVKLLLCCLKLHFIIHYWLFKLHFIIGRWVATSALPPLDKLYRRRPLFEEAAYWFTAAVCNALLTNIPSACVITEEDRSGKYESSQRGQKFIYSGMY